jgi:hypothetical protein
LRSPERGMLKEVREKGWGRRGVENPRNIRLIKNVCIIHELRRIDNLK